MYRNTVVENYFEWLVHHILPNYQDGTYKLLLRQLFDTTFVYEIEMDANRAHDGLTLRQQFENETDEVLDIDDPCSALEMMVALSIRCERDIMNIPDEGDRTYIWFWNMVENLGLSRMTDDDYDEVIVRAVMFNFLNHMYEPDGKGGLFYVPGDEDARDMEIWYQMNVYLDYIIEYEGGY